MPPMSPDEFAKVRSEIRDRLARVTLWKAQDMVRKTRKDRSRSRAKAGANRFAKEFRALKALLIEARGRPRNRATRRS